MICGCSSAAWSRPMRNPSVGPSGASETEQAGSSLPVCFQCGRPLELDEIALTKKMINRGATRFFCLSCLAAHFDVTEDILREKIREFREMGCTLFRRH